MQYGKWSGSFGGLTTGRSIRRAGTTTRVATRWATGLDDGAGVAAGPSDGIGRSVGAGRAVGAGVSAGVIATASGGSW